jgi:hypothetical protein
MVSVEHPRVVDVLLKRVKSKAGHREVADRKADRSGSATIK